MKGNCKMFKKLFLEDMTNYFVGFHDNGKFYKCMPRQEFWNLYQDENKTMMKLEGIVVVQRKVKYKPTRYFVLIYKDENIPEDQENI